MIEHLDRLPALERSLFGDARPATVVVTTPNAAHNVRFAGLAEGRAAPPRPPLRVGRDRFRAWADGVADHHGYTVVHGGVGPDDPEVGPPIQLAVFTR